MGDNEENKARLEKITDFDLLEFAQSDSDELRTILVEIELVAPLVDFIERGTTTNRVIRPKRVVVNIKQEQANVEKAKLAREAIKNVVTHPIKWLPSAHVFIVDARSEEIREITKLPSVTAIRANIALR